MELTDFRWQIFHSLCEFHVVRFQFATALTDNFTFCRYLLYVVLDDVQLCSNEWILLRLFFPRLSHLVVILSQLWLYCCKYFSQGVTGYQTLFHFSSIWNSRISAYLCWCIFPLLTLLIRIINRAWVHCDVAWQPDPPHWQHGISSTQSEEHWGIQSNAWMALTVTIWKPCFLHVC